MLLNGMHFPFERCFFVASHGTLTSFPGGCHANCLLKKLRGGDLDLLEWSGLLLVSSWRMKRLRYLPWSLDCIFVSLPWCSLFLSILTQVSFPLWSISYGSSLPLVNPSWGAACGISYTVCLFMAGSPSYIYLVWHLHWNFSEGWI